VFRNQRHRTSRGPSAPAVPPRARILTQLHGPILLENRRFRDLGQPGHVALRRQRLQRSTRLPQGHRRL